MTISESMGICHKAGIKIYGIPFKTHFQVEMSDESINDGEPTRYKKRLNSNKELNEAVTKTYMHHALLVEESNNPPEKPNN